MNLYFLADYLSILKRVHLSRSMQTINEGDLMPEELIR